MAGISLGLASKAIDLANDFASLEPGLMEKYADAGVRGVLIHKLVSTIAGSERLSKVSDRCKDIYEKAQGKTEDLAAECKRIAGISAATTLEDRWRAQKRWRKGRCFCDACDKCKEDEKEWNTELLGGTRASHRDLQVANAIEEHLINLAKEKKVDISIASAEDLGYFAHILVRRGRETNLAGVIKPRDEWESKQFYNTEAIDAGAEVTSIELPGRRYEFEAKLAEHMICVMGVNCPLPGCEYCKKGGREKISVWDNPEGDTSDDDEGDEEIAPNP